MIRIFVISFCFLPLSRPVIANTSHELYWFLAASLVTPGKEMAQKFNNENKNIKVLVIPGGSGQLLSKILASGKGDIYTPASTYFLDKALNAGIVLNYTKLLEQNPVFGLAKHAVKKEISFENITNRPYKLAVGNPKTMALGQTFLKIKGKMKSELATQIKKNEYIYALSVAQIVNYVLLGVVDAGLMFESVAKVHGISYVEIPVKYNVSEYVYLVKLKSCSNVKAVEVFENYIYQNYNIFKRNGFGMLFERKKKM